MRFIDGTFAPHARLEARIARFVDRPAARIFNSAYTTVLGLAITLAGPDTFWIGDALNHNCIIRAMRIANVPSTQRAIYQHNDLADLAAHLERVPDGTGRVIVIFDGIFSMRGDNAPVDEIAALVARHEHRFRDGVVTVMDDSHGIAAYGRTGRGTEEHCGARVDIFVGTFGKAFGVNGGFVAGSPELVEAVRQKADTYIYTNPLGAADAAAAAKAIDIADGAEGRARLANLQARTTQFRRGLESLGFESIPGPHPVVPLLVRDTGRVRTMVAGLFERGILAVGLTFPVVPKGDETIRFQINAAHTEADIDELLGALKDLKGATSGADPGCASVTFGILRACVHACAPPLRLSPPRSRLSRRAAAHHHAAGAARLRFRRRLSTRQLPADRRLLAQARRRVGPHGPAGDRQDGRGATAPDGDRHLAGQPQAAGEVPRHLTPAGARRRPHGRAGARAGAGRQGGRLDRRRAARDRDARRAAAGRDGLSDGQPRPMPRRCGSSTSASSCSCTPIPTATTSSPTGTCAIPIR